MPKEKSLGKGFQKKSGAPWNIKAKRLSYNSKDEVYEAEGDVVISRGDQFLYSQKATYYRKTGIAEVSGKVRLESAGNILSGERGTFDLNKQTGMLTNGTLFLKANHYYLKGKIVEKVAEDTYVIQECRVTTCDGVHPAWSITSSEAKVRVESYGIVRDAAFRIHDFPIFYVPIMIFPGQTQRQSGLLAPRVGYDTRNGVDLELPFFWAISDETDATFYQRYMSERGYMQGLEYRYLLARDSKGTFLSDILSDEKVKDLNDPEDVRISPFPRTNSTRYWLRGMADQDLPLGVKARFDGDFVSDQDYLREFEQGLYGYEARPDLAREFGRPVDEKYSPFRRSTLRLSRDRGAYSLQAAASYYEPPQDPSGGSTPQPLTGLDFQLLPQRIIHAPLFLELQSQYDYVWRDTGEKGHQLSLSPQVTLPLWLGPYLQLQPFVGYAIDTVWFDQDQGDGKFQTQAAYETGASLFTNLERVYDLDWHNAKRVQHQIWPSLTYRYRVPQNRPAASPWFEPIDVEGKVNQVTFSLENFLDARLENKKGEPTYVQWASLQLSQSYNIEESTVESQPGLPPLSESKGFGPLEGNMTLAPSGNLGFLGVARWDYQERQITYADVSMDLYLDRYGGRKDTYAVNYHSETGTSEALSFSTNINLVYGFSVGTSLSKDLRLNHTVSSRYWLGYDTQCWGVKVYVVRENGQNSFTASLNLLGLGNVGKK